MTYIVLMIAALILLAGIIAYAGDRLGAYIGRKRLSLFGLRPRTTGQIIGIVAGITIMLATIGVLAIMFQNATSTIVNFQRTVDELTQLRVQEQVLIQRVNDTNRQLAELRTALEDAEETIRTAHLQREEAIAERDTVLAEHDTLTEQRDDLASELEAMYDLVEQAEAAVLDAEGRLSEVEDAYQEALGDVTAAHQERDLAQAQVADAQTELAELSLDYERVQEEYAAAQTRVAAAEESLRAAEAARDGALLEQARLAEAARAFEAEIDLLDAQAADLRRRTNELSEQNELLADQSRSFRESNDALQMQNQTLGELNSRLEQEVSQRNDQVRELEANVSDLRSEVESQARQLAEVQQQYNRFASGEVYFQKDQLIYSGAIYAQEPGNIRVELANFIAEATEFVARRGVERIRVTPEQIEILVEVISQTPGSDLVRFISPSNQISTTIDVQIEALENTQLLADGQLLITKHVHLGDRTMPISQDELRTALTELRSDAIRALRRIGLDEGQLPDFGQISEEVFTSQLLRLTGPVTVGLIASGPAYTAGPAQLEFVVIY